MMRDDKLQALGKKTEYKMDYAGYRVTFVVADGKVIVKKIEKI